MQISSNHKGILFASITALLWGFLAIALKVSLKVLQPIDVAWVRFSVAFTGLILFYLITRPQSLLILKQPPVRAIFAGIFLAMNYLGFITGLHFTSPSIAQVFIQLAPVIFAVIGFVYFKETIGIIRILGIVVVIAGLILFYRDQLSLLTGNPHNYNKGILWVIIGAISWALFATFQKKLVEQYPPMQLYLVIFGLPVIALLPMIHFSEFRTLSFSYLMLLLFLGANTLAAYGSLAFALKYLEANKISVIITQNPIITFICMFMLSELHVSWLEPEHYSIFTLIGAVLVISGAVMTVFSPKRK